MFYKTQHICYAIFIILRKYWFVNKKPHCLAVFCKKQKKQKAVPLLGELPNRYMLSKLFCQDVMPCSVGGAK